MTDAISSFGTILRIGDGATPEVFTPIAAVQDITGPSMSLDTEEVTHHGSPGGWEEVVGTILRSGDVSFDVNLLPGHPTHSTGTGLLRDLRLRTRRNFQLVFPTTIPTTWAFAAFVTGYEPSAPVAGKLSASITLKITGAPTLS